MTESFRISLSGSETTYMANTGDTLLRAGLRQGLGLAYECNVGACGSCKFDLIAGEVDDLFPEASGLRPKEREKGKRLACQCVPRSDCTIKIRSGDEYLSAIPPARFKARLLDRRALTPDISLFTFASDGPAEFLAGQYAMIGIPALSQARAYSMSNIANEEGIWQFIIRRVPEGKVTAYLFDRLQLDEQLDLDGPYGIAYLRTDVSRPIVGIAGGSGLAPVLSVLQGAARNRCTNGTRPAMLYGGRTPADIPDVRRMATEAGIEVDFHPVISAPVNGASREWHGDVGFVHEFITKKLAAPLPDYEYYLAGPPPMIEAAVRLLVAEHKVPTTQIHFDRFF
jgi:toluene monooxygenase electron transfer component